MTEKIASLCALELQLGYPIFLYSLSLKAILTAAICPGWHLPERYNDMELSRPVLKTGWSKNLT
jgi:hypothetical protein